jgi:hypothetical protein
MMLFIISSLLRWLILQIFAVRFSHWIVTLTADLNLDTDLDKHRFFRQDLLDEGKGCPVEGQS